MAWVTMVSLILVMANEVAIPLDFVLRPAVVALLPALIIGVVCGPFGSVGRLAAIVAGPIVIIPELWVLAAGLAGIEAAIWLIQRRASKPRLGVGQFALFTMFVLFGLSLVRLLPSVTDYVSRPPVPLTNRGRRYTCSFLMGIPAWTSWRSSTSTTAPSSASWKTGGSTTTPMPRPSTIGLIARCRR